MTHSTVMYIITFENKFYRAFYLNLFKKYTKAYEFFFLLKMKTRIYIMMTRKYIILYSHLSTYVFTYIASLFLDDSENDAASCVYESQASYTLRMCVVPDLRETDVQQVIKVHETIQTSLSGLFLMDRSK